MASKGLQAIFRQVVRKVKASHPSHSTETLIGNTACYELGVIRHTTKLS